MKRTILYAFAIPIVILVLLLFLFNFRAHENPVKPVEIPEGWEVVSNEEDCVYIRMKEGSDSRVWIEHQDNDDFFVDVYLTGGKDHVSQTYDSDETIPVLVFFGYGRMVYDSKNDIQYIDPSLPEYTDYQLIMRKYEGDRYFTTLLLDLPNFTDSASVEYTSENKVGYTNGAIVNVPVNLFQYATNDHLNFTLRVKSKSQIDEETRIYFTHDTKKSKMIVETEHDAWENDLQYGFPQILTDPGIMTILGNYTLLLSIFIFTLLSLIRKRAYSLPHLFIALALLLNLGMTIWLDIENTGNFDLSWLIFYASLFVYLPLSAILGVVQLFVTWIQKCIAKKKVRSIQNTSTAPSTDHQ